MTQSPTKAPPPPPEGLWAALKEAIRGTDADLTAIPVRRAVFMLAVPMVLEMSMESLFAIVDIFFVSKLGSSAIATVGLTESMLSLVYALAMGLSAGATAIIARRVGEKDPRAAGAAAVQAILAPLGLAAIIGTLGALLARPLLEVMGADPDVVRVGSGYTAVMFGGCVTIFLLFVVNAIFRSSGDAVTAMRALWLSNLLNIALAPCFIFGLGPFPRMGVTGAAVATTTSRGIGVLFQFAMLMRQSGRFVLLREDVRLRAKEMKELFKIATPAALQILVETASWLSLVRIVSLFGSAALAGYTVAMRVAIFALLPSWGLANAAATLVGQNLGAGEPARAERSVYTVARYNVTFLALACAVFVAFPETIVSLISHDPSVVPYAASCLRLVAFGFVAFAFGMVAVQAFNGAGDTLTPMFVNLACFWAFKVPAAYVMSRTLGMGPRGVFLAVTAAYTVQSIVAGALFRRGRWKTRGLPAPRTNH